MIETFRDENLNRSAILVYLDLARHCNARTGALHQRDIMNVAQNLGLSQRSVYYALTELDNAGLIDRRQLVLGGRLTHVGLSTARAKLAHQRDEETNRHVRGSEAEYQRKARALEEAYGIDVAKMSREDIDKLIADLKLKIAD